MEWSPCPSLSGKNSWSRNFYNMIIICLFREGINIFLDGFVPTENLRFREESLVFKVSENASEEDVKRMNR